MHCCRHWLRRRIHFYLGNRATPLGSLGQFCVHLWRGLEKMLALPQGKCKGWLIAQIYATIFSGCINVKVKDIFIYLNTHWVFVDNNELAYKWCMIPPHVKKERETQHFYFPFRSFSTTETTSWTKSLCTSKGGVIKEIQGHIMCNNMHLHLFFHPHCRLVVTWVSKRINRMVLAWPRSTDRFCLLIKHMHWLTMTGRRQNQRWHKSKQKVSKILSCSVIKLYCVTTTKKADLQISCSQGWIRHRQTII